MTTNSGLVYGAGATALSGVLAGTEVVQVDNGSAVKVTATVQQITNLWSSGAQVDGAFATASFTQATTVTLSNLRSFTALHGTQTATALTVSMPTASLVQGQLAGFSVDVAVTTLSMTSSGTLSNPPLTTSTVSAGTSFEWAYNVVNTTWYRVK